MMTQAEVLVEMEASYAEMSADERDSIVTSDPETGVEYTPTQLLTEVRENTDVGQRFALMWAQNAEAKTGLEELLSALLGGATLPPGVQVINLDDLEEMEGEHGTFVPARASDLLAEMNNLDALQDVEVLPKEDEDDKTKN